MSERRIDEDAPIEIYFNTVDSSFAPVAPSAAFTNADFAIYKNGSATEKTTTNGLTVTSPFDSKTGLHLLSIDTSNDTGDASFWVEGGRYSVKFSTAKTVDSVSIDGRLTPNGQFIIKTLVSDNSVADAVWDEATSGHTTAGTFGAQVKTVLDDVPTTAEFEARTLVAANYFDASTDTVDLGAILGTALTQTSADNLAANFSQFFDLEVTTSNTVDDVSGATVSAIANAVWDEVISTSFHNTASTAGRFLREANLVQEEGSVSGSASATSFATNLSSATGNFYLDQLLTFTSGANAGQSRVINNYVATGGVVTFDEGFTTAPSISDTFVVYKGHLHSTTQIAKEVWLNTNASHAAGTMGHQLTTVLDDVPNTSEFEARTLVAASYFNASTDTVDVGAILGTALTQTSADNLAANFSQFFDLEVTTTNTVDDVGSGGGGDATAANQTTIINALTVIDGIVDNILVDTDTTIPAQISALNNISTVDVKTQADQALVDINLDHLLSTSVAGTDVADNSVIAKMVSSDGITADWDTFVNSTDSLQAIRDRGDSDWVTGGGGGGGDATAANQTTIINALTVIDGIVDNILTDTDTTIPAQITGLNNISEAQVNAQVDTALADYGAPTKTEMDTAFTEIKGATWSSLTDTLEAIRNQGDTAWITADISGVATASALSTVDTNVDAILVDTSTTIPAQITALNNISSADVSNAVKTLVVESEGNVTMQQALSVILSVLAGQSTNNGLTFQTPNGNASRVAATVDVNKNRTAITLTPSS